MFLDLAAHYDFELGGVAQLAQQLRDCVAPHYRPPGRITLVNFDRETITARTANRRISRVPKSWYTETRL